MELNPLEIDVRTILELVHNRFKEALWEELGEKDIEEKYE